MSVWIVLFIVKKPHFLIDIIKSLPDFLNRLYGGTQYPEVADFDDDAYNAHNKIWTEM